MKRVMVVTLALICDAAHALSAIEHDDFSSENALPATMTVLGFAGAKTCKDYKELSEKYSGSISEIAIWILKVAICFLILTMLSAATGLFNLDRNFWKQFLIGWGAIKALQGIFISGIATGVAHRSNVAAIKKEDF